MRTKKQKRNGITLAKRKPHKTLIFISIMILGGFSWYFIYTDKITAEERAVSTIAQTENIDPDPVLYSDSHITRNAVVSDPRFAVVSHGRNRDLAAGVILSGLPVYTKASVSVKPERGTWLWTPVLDITPSYRKSIISGASKNGIKNIYVSIDTYLDIYVMPNGPEKEVKKKAFGTALESFIAEARAHDITVDAEGGWRNWAEEDSTYKAFAVLDYTIEFNKTHTEKLRGFQYDVEPYLLGSYKTDKASVLRDFLDLVNKSVGILAESDLELSVVIPEFYDGRFGKTPEFIYAGESGYAIDHLLRVLEQRPGSKIIVMSYRNWAIGSNGSVDISADEIDKANAYKTKIIVAQETGDVEPPYITFHNTSRISLDTQLGMIEKAFAGDKSFGGVAIHYVNTLLDLQ